MLNKWLFFRVTCHSVLAGWPCHNTTTPRTQAGNDTNSDGEMAESDSGIGDLENGELEKMANRGPLASCNTSWCFESPTPLIVNYETVVSWKRYEFNGPLKGGKNSFHLGFIFVCSKCWTKQTCCEKADSCWKTNKQTKKDNECKSQLWISQIKCLNPHHTLAWTNKCYENKQTKTNNPTFL